MTQQQHDEAGTRTRPPVAALWACLFAGVGAALVGLLPWLVTGLRLPVQNLWATDTGPEAMPRALLPFSQYLITLIIGVLVTGAALGGLGTRAAASAGRLPRHGVVAFAVGLFAVQVGALVQTVATVRVGLRDGLESSIYLGALEAVALLSLLVGALAFGLVARAPRGGAVLGLGIGALALGPWLTSVPLPFATLGPSGVVPGPDGALGWVPAVAVGAAIGWGGLRTVGRVLAAVTGLALLWLVPALSTAITSSAGTRVLAHQPREMAAYAVEVFGAAATTPALTLPALVVALVVAALVGAVGVALGRRRRHRER